MRFLILIFIFSLPFSKAFSQPKPIELRMLQGYHANDKLKLEEGVNFKVFSREREFERYFGKIEKEGMPNFDFEHVIVMLTKPTKEQYFLTFDSFAKKAGNFIEIYCSIETRKHELTYIDHPIAIAAIPKFFAVTEINFYDKEKSGLFRKKHKLLETVRVRP